MTRPGLPEPLGPCPMMASPDLFGHLDKQVKRSSCMAMRKMIPNPPTNPAKMARVKTLFGIEIGTFRWRGGPRTARVS